MKNGVDMVFASFIRKASDVEQVREHLGPQGKHIRIVSKVLDVLPHQQYTYIHTYIHAYSGEVQLTVINNLYQEIRERKGVSDPISDSGRVVQCGRGCMIVGVVV